jgi:hypothetical protein
MIEAGLGSAGVSGGGTSNIGSGAGPSIVFQVPGLASLALLTAALRNPNRNRRRRGKVATASNDLGHTWGWSCDVTKSSELFVLNWQLVWERTTWAF